MENKADKTKLCETCWIILETKATYLYHFGEKFWVEDSSMDYLL